MRRPALAVDTGAAASRASDDLQTQQQYVPATPTTLRTSSDLKRISAADTVTSSTSSPPPSWSAPNPTIRLLFSFITRRDAVTLVIPAILASLAAAAVPGLMTIVIGSAFDAYAAFPPSGSFTDDQAKALLRGVGMAALELVALAIGAIVLSGVMAALWVWVGERNVLGLRRAVFDAIASREMQWFDTKTASENASTDEAVGAGGLMAQFARDTDDVRRASGQNMGLVIQHAVTILSTIVIAFVRAPTLAAVVLSVIPVMVFLQGVAQTMSMPRFNLEREESTAASNIIDRALVAIATVKSFNAQSFEITRASKAFSRLRDASLACASLFSVSVASNSFLSFAMFVVAFWYGAVLAAQGKVSAGDVITVFWACLMTGSTFGQLVPTLINHTRGMAAVVALVMVIDPPPSETSHSSHQPIPRTPKTAFQFNRSSGFMKHIPLRKIKPSTCTGEFSISNLSFAYPSRINMPVLSEVSFFIPSGEMTFIVGGSGSGKSTLAQILLRFYDIQAGSIELDGQSFYHLDEKWVRSHVAAVQQGCILFDGTVHENVAMGLAGSLGGRKPSEATREEVMAACRIALMHDFIRDLPNGYDTLLGTGGANLSGGQKQRLAIARAVMRDPTVLILDEATSALDGTSRLLVFEAIKTWRKNKTTIVITHDLSQITQDDFVYLLRDGRIEEQGFRHDLEAMTENGGFYKLMVEQGQTGGFLPEKDTSLEEAEQAIEREVYLEFAEEQNTLRKATTKKHRSTMVPGTFLDPPSLETLARESPMPWGSRQQSPIPPPLPTYQPATVFEEARVQATLRPRRSSLSLAIPVPSDSPRDNKARKHTSLPFTPLSPSFTDELARLSVTGDSILTTTSFVQDFSQSAIVCEDDDEFETEKQAMKRSAAEASGRRVKTSRRRWDPTPTIDDQIAADQHGTRLRKRKTSRRGDLERVQVETPSESPAPQLSFFALIRMFWPIFPSKLLFIFALIVALVTGAITPLFAYLITTLQTAVTAGQDQDESKTLRYALFVLALAIGNGIFSGLQYYLAERSGANFIQGLQEHAFKRILKQDRAWFDESENAPATLLQNMMKDTDESKQFVAWIIPKALVVIAMIGLGLIWSLVRGWQLTLVGLALGPLFAILVAGQAKLVAKYERRNKIAREDVNTKYYNVVANLRAIRSMTLESVFKEEFEKSLLNAQRIGIRGGFIDGLGFGIVNGLIYFSSAVLYYLGAVFMAKGIYSFQHFLEVFNLITFTVAFAGQLFTFVERIAKSKQATIDLKRLVFLDLQHTSESKGRSLYPIRGDVTFNNIKFAYPARPNVQVFNGLSFEVKANECVAIVGASGSGKSTSTALLQRLYEPISGAINIGRQRLSEIDVNWLRDHVAVVSQQPYLFDASIADNITYGMEGNISQEDIERVARAANVHDFIMSLPEGYGTYVGANASQISGGQAQRIQIARALIRSASILILDECTSALDPTNQKAVMAAIEKAKNGRTTIIVTHKLPMMQMADRIIVLADGIVAEEGHYDDLMQKKGAFYKLATAGEWEGEN